MNSLSTRKFQNQNKYNYFHRNTKPVEKVITERNFTYEIFVKLLNKILDTKTIKSALDYGCGAGALSLYLADKGINVLGFDISTAAIQS